MLKFNPDKIILGCTHYPYLIEKLENFADRNLFIDPAQIFVEYIKQDLLNTKMLNNQNKIGSEEFFVSAKPENFIKNSKIFYDVQKLPTLIKF